MTAATLSPVAAGAVTRRTEGIAERRAAAEALGRRLAEETADPTRFAGVLDAGLAGLADPADLEATRRVAPGIGSIHGVRWPLLEAIGRGFRSATRGERTSGWLFVADRLLGDPRLEARWFAFGLLERLVGDDPERTWQLIRRAARDAGDWITIDSLAHPTGRGILNEAYRWAELEQLVFSPSPWERRLVGSTIATIPFVDRELGRRPEVAVHGLGLVRDLIGDDEPYVQKALSWAVRAMTLVDAAAATVFLEAEADQAVATDDGYRAWVIRDSLSKLDPGVAARIRARLDGIRRRPGAPSTSRAAETAARFGAGLLGRPLPEPPLA